MHPDHAWPFRDDGLKGLVGTVPTESGRLLLMKSTFYNDTFLLY